MARRIVLNLRDARPVWKMPDWVAEEVRAALPRGWDLVLVTSAADGRGDGGGGPSPETLEAVQGAEIYVGSGFPRPLFLAAAAASPGQLRWVHTASAGVGGSLYPEMRDSDITLTNSAGIFASPIAETVLAMVLYFARGLDFAVAAQARGEWDKGPFESADTPVREISGTTIGIVGLGGIGKEVARRAAALGMHVLATRRKPAPGPAGVELLHGKDGLRELLQRSDHVVLAVPETAQTRGLIGAGELANLRPGAVLINIARGGVVDESALIATLQSGTLRAAALDVFQEEPLPAESPLWNLPNALVMPHVSGTSHRFWRRQADLLVGNLRAYLSGTPLQNVVNKESGY